MRFQLSATAKLSCSPPSIPASVRSMVDQGAAISHEPPPSLPKLAFGLGRLKMPERALKRRCSPVMYPWDEGKSRRGRPDEAALSCGRPRA